MNPRNANKLVRSVSRLCLLTLALFASALVAQAQAPLPYTGIPQNSFSVGATNNGQSFAYCTIPANSVNGGAPVVTQVSAACNAAGIFLGITNGAGVIQFWRIVDQTIANYANTSTSVPVSATNSFVSGDFILVRHLTNDSYERLILTTPTSATNLTLSAGPAQTINTNDIIYRLSATNCPCIPIGLSTNFTTVTGARLVVGQKGLPLFVSILGVSGTTGNSLYSVAGYYEPDTPVTIQRLSP